MFYKIARFVCIVVTKVFFRPKIVGIENIPLSGHFIIAANHTSMFDPLPIIASTKRRVHFLAKASIFKFPQGIIFSNLELIPVYRDKDNEKAYSDAVNYLKEGHVIGIFPEGTRERGKGLLSFKYGTVKMAEDTNSKIVPVAIKGGYNIFKNKLTFVFGKPITINGNIKKENDKLRETIENMLNNII